MNCLVLVRSLFDVSMHALESITVQNKTEKQNLSCIIYFLLILMSRKERILLRYHRYL